MIIRSVKNGRFQARPFFKRLIFFVLFLAIITILGFICFPPSYGIEIVNQDNNTLERFKDVDSFQIMHTHSVMKTPVIDYYEVKDSNKLIQARTDYKSLGAGLPFDGIGEFEQKNGWFIRTNIDNVIPTLKVRVGRTADHTLEIDHQEIPLNHLETPGKRVELRPRLVLFSFFWL